MKITPHIYHTGRVPDFIDAGFSRVIICTHGTKTLKAAGYEASSVWDTRPTAPRAEPSWKAAPPPGKIKPKTWFALVKKHIYNMLNTKMENEQYCIGFEGEI
ncbi:MAG: hypothetical protein K9K21_09995 [Desulfotignum sp.]|nr:hypothetical protein [Desulfotignum sp.]